MTILDKVRAAAGRTVDQTRRSMELGRSRMDEMQAQRQHRKLLEQLGEACYAEHTGAGTHEPAERTLAALDAHTQARKQMRAASRLLPARQARDIMHPGAECIIADRDITIKCTAEGRDPTQIRAGELAQETVFWVDATADIGEVLHQMEDHQVKRLPVLENHRLVGIISEADLARHLDEHRLAEFVEKVYATN